MKNHTVIFEEIFPRHRWILKIYFLLAGKVFFLRVHRSCVNEAWFKRGVERQCLLKIDPGLRVHFFDGIHYDMAFDNIDNVFSSIKDNHLLKKVRELYGNDKIDLAFKKDLNERLARFYYLNHIMHSMQKEYPGGTVRFIPSNGIDLYRTDGCEVLDYGRFYKQAGMLTADRFDTGHVAFPLWTVCVSYVNFLKRKGNGLRTAACYTAL